MADAGGRERIRYGKINTELMRRWVGMEPSEDGPFWALNLMKYRNVADYGDGRGDAVSGRDADDAYTPREALEAIGAEIAFAANVERTLAGDGTSWDRVGIVRYPSRRKFFEMQQRDDFKSKHVHKDAGMEFTIVMSCLPMLPFAGGAERYPWVELDVSAGGAAPAEDAGARATAAFHVEGVIVGDERTFVRATFRWRDEPPAETPAAHDAAAYVLLLRSTIDRLTRTVVEAGERAG